MQKKALIAALTLGSLLSACNSSTGTNAPEQAAAATDLPGFYQQIGDDYVSHNPSFASQLALSKEQAGYNYAASIEDYSPEGDVALRKSMADHVAALDALGEAADPANIAIIRNITAYYAGSADHPQGYIDSWGGHLPYIVNQINGPLIDLPQTLQDKALINSAEDVDNYLARLAAMESMVDGVIAKMNADAETGWVAPMPILEGAIASLQRFTSLPAAEHPLVTKLADKMAKADALDADARKLNSSMATDIVDSKLYPAYKRAEQAVAALKAKAASGDGIWAQPGGTALYSYLIGTQGDSNLSAAEIHDLGLAEVERIGTEMDALLRSVGLTDGTVGERATSLLSQDRFIYEDSDAGRKQLLDDLNGEIAEINKLIPQYFKSIPTQKVEVRRIPKLIEAGAPGGQYQSPSLDGTQPGIYWINLRDMRGAASFTLKTLTYHEAVPGHHFQISLNQAQSELPFLRRVGSFNAYTEGWALYSELLAKEMGMYKGDPYGDIGRLQDEMFRAVRLVVDTGMHHHKWTREKAIKYMADVTGKDESEVVPEIERYMAWPGQALGYKLGMLKMLELREKARTALGDQFDIREFHDQVLLPGGMPMAQLEKLLDQWIASRKS